MLESISKYASYKSEEKIKAKKMEGELKAELGIVIRILKAAGYPTGHIERSKRDNQPPDWLDRRNTFQLLDMFARELERGEWQRPEQIENTERVLAELKETQNKLEWAHKSIGQKDFYIYRLTWILAKNGITIDQVERDYCKKDSN